MNDTKKTRGVLQALYLKHWAAIRFLILFGILLLIFFSIFYFFEDSFYFLREWTAQATGVLAGVVGLDVTVTGTLLLLNSLSFDIIQECTGLFAVMIFLSCVLAYSTTPLKKFKGILMGVPLIFGFNLLRMIVLVYIGESYPDSFEYVHSYLWQGIFIIIVIFIFLLWVEKIVYHDKSTTH